MSLVIGLSGAQGGGKSSLLNELGRRGFKIDAFRVARAVQNELGWNSLERVMDSPASMMEFQNEVFEQKYKNDSQLKYFSNSFTLTERTFADIWAYTALWTWRFVDQGRLSIDDALNFITPYAKRCEIAQNETYDAVILLPLMDHVVWENDANRASKDDADTVYNDVEQFVERRMPFTKQRLKISERSIHERSNQVETFLRSIW